MPELGPFGSVRGVCSNAHPYRDTYPPANTCARAAAPISALTTVASAFLLFVSLTLTASTWAQQPARLTKIGILSLGGAADAVCGFGAQGAEVGCFVEGLRALGYVDGRNVSRAW